MPHLDVEALIDRVDLWARRTKDTRRWHLTFMFVAWLYFSLRSLSFLWFTTTNPGILGSGVRGDSKFVTLQKLKVAAGNRWGHIIPTTVRITRRVGAEDLLEAMEGNGDWERTDSKPLSFPVIAKPDLGVNSWRVHLVENLEQLVAYARSAKADFLLQEWVDSKLEHGIFYYRFPGEKRGIISSIGAKNFLSVSGDGVSTLSDLLKREWKKVEIMRQANGSRPEDYFSGEQLSEVPMLGRRINVGKPGNPHIWTAMRDDTQLANDDIREMMDILSLGFQDGFYYGRYDVRYDVHSDDELTSIHPATIRILELNGAASVALHIYGQGYTLREVWNSCWAHWCVCFQIAMTNKKNGVKAMSMKEAMKVLRELKSIGFKEGEW